MRKVLREAWNILWICRNSLCHIRKRRHLSVRSSGLWRQVIHQKQFMINTSDKWIYHLQFSDKSYQADCLSALFRDKNREATICLHVAVLCRCLLSLSKDLARMCFTHSILEPLTQHMTYKILLPWDTAFRLNTTHFLSLNLNFTFSYPTLTSVTSKFSSSIMH